MHEMAPTQANIDSLLMKKPLSQCEVTSNWSTHGWLADNVIIHPNKPGKKSFDKCRP